MFSCETCVTFQGTPLLQNTAGQLLLIFCYSTYRLVFQQYTNVVTTSCLEFPGKAICKQSTVFTLKKFRVNKKKARSRVTFCGRSRLNKPESTQHKQSSGDVLQRRCSEVLVKFAGKHLHRNLQPYLKRDSYIGAFL